MKQLLYPQLPTATALQLAKAYGSMSVTELRANASAKHESAVFSATGGTRISGMELATLAAEVRGLHDVMHASEFDTALAKLLRERMFLSRAEASLDGVWSFFGCVLLPDVVRWRFSSSSPTPEDRFTGASRGVRNVLGRCWWRGELLFDEHPPELRSPYWLLEELGEDELTGLIERQRAVASRRVAVALARALVEVDRQGVPQMNVARDAFKRYLRLGYFVAFDALDDGELAIACRSLYLRSVRSLVKERA